ncbi:hypothetical protein ASPZODRAFT_127481 [Penicilliopsis zonata CBS 506.65]|uniref:histone acetyltransferase n=1 Tax=Penicilliopsis zonata CBS 506.65 TaxID=1073090 RepID=A0A1L9SWJ0_9EURO|nr:hypothetical protein ASPZODRAFT_127481 [Penicilliopsis zonata CBS 506.65]OJJ51413.1 hypothetical protein ASPZODRAFT_127481 [Penicilliopsis zonata CBS 506.65]
MAATESPPHTSTPPAHRNVQNVVLGSLLFRTWYKSIYPEELVHKDTERLYVCRWCFRYACDADAHVKHTRVCDSRTVPSGVKVYDCQGYAVWEIDGAEHTLFSQNLSLFAKLFVDHKSVFFDVSSFLYYILTFTDPEDPESYYILGYFSKEKLSWDANNLACILIFPPYQHKQLGKLLMSVSYKLSGWEREGGFIGGPERPLSEMGRRSYSRFWAERIARHFLVGSGSRDEEGTERLSLSPAQKKKSTPNGTTRKRPHHHQECMTVQEIGQATGMLVEDVITTLKDMGVVEPDKARKKRNLGPSSSATPASTEDSRSVVIRKTKVLDWATSRRVSLQDPVRNEGFIGGWLRESSAEVQSIEDGESSDSS